MVKHFCDRCEKETENMAAVLFKTQKFELLVKTYHANTTRKAELCRACVISLIAEIPHEAAKEQDRARAD